MSSGFYPDAHGDLSGTCSFVCDAPALQLLLPAKLLLLLPDRSLLLPWGLQENLYSK